MHPSDEEELDDATTARAMRRRLGRPEKMALLALGAVVTLFAAGKLADGHRLAKQRGAVLAEQTALASTYARHDLELPARVATFATELAAGPWAGNSLSPRLSRSSDAAALFAQPGVYLRLSSTMAGDPAAIHEGAKTSAKDALSTCFLLALHEPEADPMAATTACEPGTGCLGDRTSALHNLRELHRGLDVLSTQFRRDVEDADGLALHALGEQLTERAATDVPAAAALAASAAYALVVVDEVPQGFSMPWFTPSLEALQATPHTTRVAVLDAHTGEPLLRVRLAADRTAAAAAWPSAAATRQVQGCGLGLDLASYVESSRSAAR